MMAELWSLVEEPKEAEIEGYYRLFMFGYTSEPTPADPSKIIKRVRWFGCGVVGDYLKAVPADGSNIKQLAVK